MYFKTKEEFIVAVEDGNELYNAKERTIIKKTAPNRYAYAQLKMKDAESAYIEAKNKDMPMTDYIINYRKDIKIYEIDNVISLMALATALYEKPLWFRA